MLTFKMDPETLRRQMAKAGAAAATVSNEVRRAGDIGADLDPDAPLVIKRRKSIGSFIFLVVKVLGFAIIGAGILTAILYAISLSSS